MRLANLPWDMPQASLNSWVPLNVEIKLYDYAVQVGDTVPWKYGNKVVQAIDYVVTTEGDYVRRIKFGTVFGSDDHWYQGMGGSFGLFSPIYVNDLQGSMFTFYYPLCINGPNHSYVFTTNSPLYLFSALSGLEEEFGNGKDQTEVAITMYNNPASTNFIHIKTSVQNLEQVYFTDLAGRKINPSFTNNSGEISIKITDKVSRGMYFVHLQTGQGKLFSKKIVLAGN